MQPPRRTIDLRSANRQNVLRRLYFSGTMSRLELSQVSKLSPATVTNVVNDLLREEIVIETGLAESEGGRPRTMLAINPQYGYFVGVDLGENHIQIELFDTTLAKLNVVGVQVPPERSTPEQYVELIATGLDELLEPAQVRASAVLGIGIGLPGLVERGGTNLVSSPLWKWQNVAFWDVLRTHISLPVCLDNGAKALTLAEAWFGAGKGVQNLLTILIGTGIGAGIIAGESLYRGPTNSAGEFGHTIIVLDGRPCRCGSNGCIEAYASAPGMIATLRELAPESPILKISGQGDPEAAILDALVYAASQGDVAALETIRTTAHYLGASVASLVNLLNPERIVVGGWAGLKVGAAILPDLRRELDRYALPLSRNVVRVDLCRLGQDAICMGAACLVLDEFLAGNPKFMRRENA